MNSNLKAVNRGLVTADRRLLRGNVLADIDPGPQRATQPGLKQGNRSQIGPRGAIEDRAHRSGVDACRAPDVSSGAVAHLHAQVDGQLPRGLRTSVIDDHVGPGPGERNRVRSGLARHVRIVSPATDEKLGITIPLADSDHQAHAGNNQRQSEDAVSRFIGAHGSRIPDEYWARIRPFVASAIADMGFSTTHSAKNYFTVCTRFVDWSNRTSGQPLEREQIFVPENIDNFVIRGCGDLALSTRATYRSRLLQMSDKLLVRPYRSPYAPSMGTFGNASEPFTDDEVRRLKVWALRQHTQYRCVNATVLLGLGLGAGLATAEIIAVTAGDIAIDEDGVVIRVGGKRPRQVPMRCEWEFAIVPLASSAIRPSLFLFGSKRRVEHNANLVNAFLEDASAPPVRLTPQRMRATWIVFHLANRVPPNAIAVAAGLSKVEGLARFAPFVPEVDEATIRTWLRDARSAQPLRGAND